MTGMFPCDASVFDPASGEYPIPLVAPEWRQDTKNLGEWFESRPGDRLSLIGMTYETSAPWLAGRDVQGDVGWHGDLPSAYASEIEVSS